MRKGKLVHFLFAVGMPKKNYYAVSVGRKRGIFKSWDDCKKQVDGFKNAKYKGFKTIEEAQGFLGIFAHANEASEGSQNIKNAKETWAREEFEVAPVAKRPRVRQTNEKATQDVPSIWSVSICFDGGSRGNPGLAGSGAEVIIVERTLDRIQKARRKIQLRKYLGTAFTCNMAEWQGVVSGLLQVVDQVEKFCDSNQNIKPQIDLVIQGDSQLVIRQLQEEYQCKKPELRKLKGEFDATMKNLKKMVKSLKVSYQHVLRGDNAVADRLANEAMDAQKSWMTIAEDLDDGDDDSSLGETRVFADV